MPKLVLTDSFCRTVAHPEEGQVLYFDEHKDAPAGFALRVTRGSKSWILNYYVEGRQRRMTLPVGYGESPLWGPRRARSEAAKVKTSVHAGADPIADQQAKRDARLAVIAEADARKHQTLGALLEAYVADMRRGGKASARSVERCLYLHVESAWPKLWTKPAATITEDELLDVVAKLANEGKLREAGKLRAYLRAAYAAAVRARRNATAMPELRAMKITHNPAADLETVEGGGGAPRQRALSAVELRAYWRRVCELPEQDRALMTFHLLTGGQRVEQLARLTADDFDSETLAVRLFDGKGRRRVPRIHDVPLIPDALAALETMRGDRGPFLFTITAGATGAAYAVLQHRVTAACEAMMEAGELEKGAFTVGDLRRTVETRLAASGVGLEVRAQLQSHGLGGVQAKHYDRHDYLSEKRAALEKLRALCEVNPAEPKPGNVTPIRRGKVA